MFVRLIMLSLLTLCLVMSGSAQGNERVQTGEQLEIIQLSESNTLAFRGVVTDESVAQMQLKLMEMSGRLAKTDVIYLVLDTPGGSVEAGQQLVDFIKGLPQRVKTITVFAASMGFHFAQNLDERLILPSGTLMSHRASIRGIGGEIPGELLTRINFVQRSCEIMDEVASARMSLDLKAYQELIRDEYWVRGPDAVRQKAADRMVYTRCDESLQGTEKLLLGRFLGIPVFGVMSKCPTITGLLAIELGEGGSDEEREEAEQFLKTYKLGLSQVVQDYIVTGQLAKKQGY